MKSLFVFCVVSCAISTTYCQAPVSSSDFNKLGWLAGNWSLTNPKAGRSGTENWKKLSPTEWRGRGVSMKGSDTLFVEKLQLVTRDGSIYYVADIPENKTLVYFKFTRITEAGFECENPQHDFPKKIAYSMEGTMLRAIISGNGKSVEYLFEKK